METKHSQRKKYQKPECEHFRCLIESQLLSATYIEVSKDEDDSLWDDEFSSRNVFFGYDDYGVSDPRKSLWDE